MRDGPYVVKVGTNQAARRGGKSPVLHSLDIELTERCNNNCIHCYINLPADHRAARGRELTTQQVETILREAAALGCLTVRFTGGEPLLREDFEELYLFARKLGLRVIIFTNSCLVTPALADLLSRIPPLERLEITIYGMKRESYEAVSRTPGSFDAAWRGISLLLDRKVLFQPKSVLLPHNMGERHEFEAWASTLPGVRGQPSYLALLDLRCRRDSAEKNRTIRSLRLPSAEVVALLSARRDEYLKEMRNFCARFVGPPGDEIFRCGAGVASGCVDAYGRFQPCMFVRHPAAVRDLSEGCLKNVLTDFFPGLRKTRASDPEYLTRCARCFLKGLCEQCPGRSWMEHGTLDTPVEYSCDIAHAQAADLGLLEPGEKGWQIRDWRRRLARFAREEPGCPREARATATPGHG